MKKSIIGFGFVVALMLQATSASALSCLPIDMYLDTTIGDETTQIFIGTATEVKNHTQVVTVSKALKGWVPSTVWVEHPYSNDWQYFCSNGPAKVGAATVFLTTINEFGTFSVTQTLPANSDLAQKFIKDIEAHDSTEAGITPVSPTERTASIRESMINLIKVLSNMFAEFRYWESQK